MRVFFGFTLIFFAAIVRASTCEDALEAPWGVNFSGFQSPSGAGGTFYGPRAASPEDLKDYFQEYFLFSKTHMATLDFDYIDPQEDWFRDDWRPTYTPGSSPVYFKHTYVKGPGCQSGYQSSGWGYTGGGWREHCEGGVIIRQDYGWFHTGARRLCPTGYSGTTGLCYLQETNVQDCPSKSAPRKNVGARNCVGNPCNLATGNKYQLEVDYIGAGSRFPLRFERHYNSDIAHSFEAGKPKSAFQLHQSHLGNGWTHTYARRIVRPYFPSELGYVWTLAGDRKPVFVMRPDGSYTAFDSATGESLDPDRPGVLHRFTDGS